MTLNPEHLRDLPLADPCRPADQTGLPRAQLAMYTSEGGGLLNRCVYVYVHGGDGTGSPEGFQ